MDAEFHVAGFTPPSSRSRRPAGWLASFIFRGSNTLFVVSWFVFQVFPVWMLARLNIEIGLAIDAFGPAAGGEAIDIVAILVTRVPVLILLAVGAPLVSILANFSREIIAQRVERDVRARFYAAILGKSQSFHDTQRVGDIMARATNDVRMINYLVSPALTVIMESLLSIIVPSIVILQHYPPEMIVAPVVFVVAFGASLRGYMRKLDPVTTKIQEEYGNLDAEINESLSGIEIVKATGKEDEASSRFEQVSDRYRRLVTRQGEIQARYLPVLLVAVLVTTGVLHGIVLHEAGVITIGGVVAYIGLLVSYRFAANLSVWSFSLVSRAASSVRRILELEVASSEIGELDDPVVHAIDGRVTFENVSFTYPGSTVPVLKKVSFVVEPGQVVAIVGTTGSGKTTMTKLVSRLHDPGRGQVTIDGIDARRYSLQSLRSQVAYIEQDVFLFSKTVRDNIAFGCECSEADVVRAATDAQAHEFIRALPDGYNTQVGERGVRLSGGEKQRIAIARALLTNPRILVLDDSTSAIDSRTEEAIQRAIVRILHGRTTLLVTHRLSMIRWADLILVVSRGEIVAKGSHEQLLRDCEEYRRIFTDRFNKTLDELLGGGTR